MQVKQQQVSLRNLITTQQPDFIDENRSQQGSIIDLLRKDSSLSNNDIGNLGQGRIVVGPEEVKSLKGIEKVQQEEQNPFEETAQSQLIIEDAHLNLKKIQSERVCMHEYFPVDNGN